MTDWTPADRAFQYVLAIELVHDVAYKKLIECIQNGKIPASADQFSLIFEDQTGVMPSYFWHKPAHIHFDFAKGVCTRIYPADTTKGPNVIHRASGISFSTLHLRQCFSPVQDEQKARPHRPKGSGYAESDELLFPKIQEFIEGKKKLSPTAATWLVIGRDGEGAAGSGQAESKMKRVRDRYKSSGK